MNSYSAYNFGITKESLKDVQFYKNYLKSSVQSINDYNNHLVVKTVIIGSQVYVTLYAHYNHRF